MSSTSSPLSNLNRLYDLWSCSDFIGSAVITAMFGLQCRELQPLYTHLELPEGAVTFR